MLETVPCGEVVVVVGPAVVVIFVVVVEMIRLVVVVLDFLRRLSAVGMQPIQTKANKQKPLLTFSEIHNILCLRVHSPTAKNLHC